MKDITLLVLVISTICSPVIALDHIQVIDDGYLVSSEGFMLIEAEEGRYTMPESPNLESAEVANSTHSILINQNNVGYLVFDIGELNKVGPKNASIIKLYLDGNSLGFQNQMTSYSSLRLSGPYPNIKSSVSTMTSSPYEYISSRRGPGSPMLADVTESIIALQEYGINRAIFRLEPSVTYDQDGSGKFSEVEIKSMESGHPAELIVV